MQRLPPRSTRPATLVPYTTLFLSFEVGMTLTTPARTVTSTDIVNFACLTGDFNEVHCNYEYAKTTPFGEVIAHGPLVYGIAGGLQYRSEEHTSELQSLMRISYSVFCLKKKNSMTKQI